MCKGELKHIDRKFVKYVETCNIKFKSREYGGKYFGSATAKGGLFTGGP